jgi:recombination associated protein RdgC
MLKSAIIYRIAAGWTMPNLEALEEALGANRFAACGPTQTESYGWVEPRGEKHGPLVESVGGQIVLNLRTEVRSVPASAVKEAVDARCVVIEQQTGRKPGKKQKNELKEEVLLELLPRAFTKSSVTTIWLDPKNLTLVVGAGSVSKADKVTTALVQAFSMGDGISLHLIGTKTSPSTAMSTWLRTQEAPYAFSVDRECELKLDGSAVRYSRHTLEITEIVEHIRQGKVATQLAMTWNGRVSFVLTDTMLVKKVEFLEGVFEGKSAEDKSGFDADVAISTGELSRLFPDLFEALDGEAPKAGEAAAEAEKKGADAETRAESSELAEA